LAVGCSQRAREDLGTIFARIATDNRGAAERWIGRILEHTDLAAEGPFLGRIVPELGQADIRETYLRSYRIVYRTDGQDLWVLTVFEGSRQLRSSDLDDDG
jgi:plasmid stabilization system protein ParE